MRNGGNLLHFPSRHLCGPTYLQRHIKSLESFPSENDQRCGISQALSDDVLTHPSHITYQTCSWVNVDNWVLSVIPDHG